MSRSHKKPVIKHRNNKFYKKQFNRNIRRSETTYQGKGMSYKKANCTWNICDFNTGELSKEKLEKYGKEKYKITIK